MIQVTFNLPLEGGSPSVKEVFDSLSEEDKKEIAKEFIEKWISEDHQYEKQVKEKEVIKKIGNESYYKDKSEEDIRNSYNFRNEMKEFTSMKDQMIKDISSEMLKQVNKSVNDTVRSDEYVNTLKSVVNDLLEDEFPSTVMKLFALKLIEDFSKGTRNLDTFIDNLKFEVEDINNRLNNNGY